MSRNILYISWDGPRQAYMETLFLPLLAAAQSEALRFGVFQFVWTDDEEISRIADAARRLDVAYAACTDVWREPRAMIAPMIARGAQMIARHARQHGYDTLFPRSIIPAAMALGAQRLEPSLRLLFDADGFMADERVEFGGWAPNGAMYRAFRSVEAQITLRADAIMTRTARAKDVLIARGGPGVDPARIFVIPNGRDEALFSPGDADTRAATRARLGIEPDAPVIVYAGSIGPQYFPERMAAFTAHAQQLNPRATMLALTGGESLMRAAFDALPDTLPVDMSRVHVQRVLPEEVPAHLAIADLGLSFRASSFSQRVVCPVKIAEYLLCGVPIASTTGVGDVDDLLHEPDIGFALDNLDDDTLREAAAHLAAVCADREQWRTSTRATGCDVYGLRGCGDTLQKMCLEGGE